jgi:glutathione peroxidase-family protein
LPTKILIDPQGIIIGRFAADASPDEYLDNKLKELFNE